VIQPSDYGPLFLLAASLDGDLEKTAALASVDHGQLVNVSQALKWTERFQALKDTRDQDGPDALARELNRMTNLTQAQRSRDLLDAALRHFTNTPVEDLTSVSTKDSANHSARVLVDLVKSIETVQNLTYRALGDTATERTQESRLLGPGRLAAASKATTPASTLVQTLDEPVGEPEALPEPPPPKKKPLRPRLRGKDIMKRNHQRRETRVLTPRKGPSHQPSQMQDKLSSALDKALAS
jgi:hypothetical protein